jgi:hypothetical protein
MNEDRPIATSVRLSTATQKRLRVIAAERGITLQETMGIALEEWAANKFRVVIDALNGLERPS